MTTMYRKTTCNGCGMAQTTNVSYRLDKKLWATTHTLEVCRQRKNDQAVEDLVERLFMN